MTWPNTPKSPTESSQIIDAEDDDNLSIPLEPIVEIKDENKPTDYDVNNNNSSSSNEAGILPIAEETLAMTEEVLDQEELENRIMEAGGLENGPVFVEILTVEISEIPLQDQITTPNMNEIDEGNLTVEDEATVENSADDSVEKLEDVTAAEEQMMIDATETIAMPDKVEEVTIDVVTDVGTEFSESEEQQPAAAITDDNNDAAPVEIVEENASVEDTAAENSEVQATGDNSNVEDGDQVKTTETDSENKED